MTVDITEPNDQDNVSLQELMLYHEITDYRVGLGLDPVPLSAALSTTAGRHVVDVRENIWGEGREIPTGANLHSWSDANYYVDQRAPEVMWDAPGRVGVDYGSAGYEIAAAGYATVEDALEGWKASPAHNAVLANLDVWADRDFLAMGVGVDNSPGAGIYAGRIYYVWFGEVSDASTPEILGSDAGDIVSGTVFGDRIHGRSGDDEIRGDLGDDEIRGGSGSDRLSGDAGDDLLHGGADGDRLYGGGGDDRVYGVDGDDRLAGGGGDDRIAGGDGDDSVNGGPGSDVLSGGAGRDVFEFSSGDDSPVGATRDVILDFERGLDTIDLEEIDAVAATAQDDAFVFIGRREFSLIAGELRRANGLIEGDMDGDGLADFQIELRPGTEIQSVDDDGDGLADRVIEVAVIATPAADDFLL